MISVRKMSQTPNANDLWLELKDKLHTAVDKHVPSKTVGKRNNTPWIKPHAEVFA